MEANSGYHAHVVGKFRGLKPTGFADKGVTLENKWEELKRLPYFLNELVPNPASTKMNEEKWEFTIDNDNLIGWILQNSQVLVDKYPIP